MVDSNILLYLGIKQNHTTQLTSLRKMNIICANTQLDVKLKLKGCFSRENRRETKGIQAVSPWRILFGKGRRE